MDGWKKERTLRFGLRRLLASTRGRGRGDVFTGKVVTRRRRCSRLFATVSHPRRGVQKLRSQTRLFLKSSDSVHGPHNIKPVLFEFGHAQIHATFRFFSE